MTDSLPTTASSVRYEESGGVATIALDRESALNAFDAAQYDGVYAALGRAADDDAIRCVLITARGRAFSAGSDLQDDSPDPAAYERFIAGLESFPKPVVAAVNGLAVGIGATLLGHCDIVLASTDARLKLPFASIGLVPEAGSTVTLPAAMGPQAAAHALFTGGWVSAAEAERAGLLWRVVEPEALAAAAAELCAEIAALPLESLTATKQLLLAARLPAAKAAREREEREFARMLTGAAHLAAVERFRSGARG